MLEALCSSTSSSTDDHTGSGQGLSLLRELACSTQSGAGCKLIMDRSTGGPAAGVQQVRPMIGGVQLQTPRMYHPMLFEL